MLLCNFVLFNDAVKAVSPTSLDEGWELIASGLNDGTSGYIEFTNEFPSYTSWFKTSANYPYNGVKSFMVDSQGGAGQFGGWWNLTENFNFISNITFWVRDDFSSVTEDIRMSFFNDDTERMRLIFDSGLNGIVSYGVTEGSNHWDDLTTGEYTNNFFMVDIGFNHTNFMKYKLYNESLDLVTSGEFELYSSDVWETFEYVYLGFA